MEKLQKTQTGARTNTHVRFHLHTCKTKTTLKALKVTFDIWYKHKFSAIQECNEFSAWVIISRLALLTLLNPVKMNGDNIGAIVFDGETGEIQK